MTGELAAASVLVGDWLGGDWLLSHEPAVRLGAFVSVLALVMLWETLTPRRGRLVPKSKRWTANLALVVVDTLALRGIGALALRSALPFAAVAMSQIAANHGWGLFNRFAAPAWLAFLGSFVALDLAIYFQHRLFHYVPVLWRLHLVHHADRDFDVTTGIRFHPIEIVLSMLIKLGAVTLLGAPVVAVIAFEVLLNATSLFNHANASLPAAVDRVLRWIVVTPDMHRVHHSHVPRETNSNFGFNLPWWDRLFSTYRAEPEAGHDAMTIGIDAVGTDKNQSLAWMLALPFRSEASGQPGRQNAPR